ncbi:MAG: DNA polymerase III subunit epsilon [Gammaproteobacteria bacterium AqS3]|nr:DNA polymerase III subunit epsilon [Gammaproteobacteria bacterium AqS3]
MRQIFLDTETTGLEPSEGHRIIEIGCVEVIDSVITESHFQSYFNPQRRVDVGARQVHGLDDAFLSDKPVFADVAPDWLGWMSGADEVVMHNAEFDRGFVEAELQRLQGVDVSPWRSCTCIDALSQARMQLPGLHSYSLDNLCRTLGIDLEDRRDVHGALIDATLLAHAYLRMMGQQCEMTMTISDYAAVVVGDGDGDADGPALIVQRASPDELALHEAFLRRMQPRSGDG